MSAKVGENDAGEEEYNWKEKAPGGLDLTLQQSSPYGVGNGTDLRIKMAVSIRGSPIKKESNKAAKK